MAADRKDIPDVSSVSMAWTTNKVDKRSVRPALLVWIRQLGKTRFALHQESIVCFYGLRHKVFLHFRVGFKPACVGCEQRILGVEDGGWGGI
ncbi:MAG: hypothetical protein P8166_02375 [Candidatus Thiodiazotropha sp.]